MVHIDLLSHPLKAQLVQVGLGQHVLPLQHCNDDTVRPRQAPFQICSLAGQYPVCHCLAARTQPAHNICSSMTITKYIIFLDTAVCSLAGQNTVCHCLAAWTQPAHQHPSNFLFHRSLFLNHRLKHSLWTLLVSAAGNWRNILLTQGLCWCPI